MAFSIIGHDKTLVKTADVFIVDRPGRRIR